MELPRNNTEIDAAVPDIAGRDILPPAIDAEDGVGPAEAMKGPRLHRLPFDLLRVDI